MPQVKRAPGGGRGATGRFCGKAVLVTGAGQHTGLAIADRFSAEGATVFVNDVSAALADAAVARLRRRGRVRLVGLPGDIGSPAAVGAIFARLARRSRRLDVVVNNAAHQGVGHGFLDTPAELFEAVVRVNLIGTFLVSQQAAKLMAARGGGSIVNIGSNVSTRAIHARSAYVASKGGIDALTLAMAVDLAPAKVRVNVVAPGYIRTTRWDRLPAARVRRRRANVPLGREATGDDVADAVLFLASDQAAHVTGARLVVDGGCSAQHLPVDADV